MLWLVLIPMVLVAAAAVVMPLLRPETAPAADAGGGLSARLAEIERLASEGEIGAAQASALRLEAERRALAEAREAPVSRPLGAGAGRAVAAGLGLLVLVGAGGLYGLMGRPDMADQEPEVAVTPPDSQAQLIAGLEAQARETPTDPELLAALAQAYAQAGRYEEAAEVFALAANLAPAPGLYSARGEALVQVAGGVVTDPAFEAFQAAAALDPAEPRSRYFLALRKDQTGDRDGAMEDWISLLNEAPPGAPWVAQVQAFVEEVAAERGISLEGRLNPPAASGSPGS